MTQREIIRPTLLLDDCGRLAKPGYARKMNYIYNRRKLCAPPFSLKEWDFYQLALGSHVLQMTVGHVSYMASFSASLFSIETGERHSFTRLRPLPLRGLHMPLNPDMPGKIEVKGSGFHMFFDVRENERILCLKADGKDGPIDIFMLLPHIKNDEAMVIATPFDKAGQFYLNSKKHYYGVEGYACFGDKTVSANGTQTALLDWGRGVWPFHQEWFWGCGSANINSGRFGFNIGWGFGDLSHAGENMFFWNGKAYKLGKLIVERREEDYMSPWRFISPDGNFDLTLNPVFDNYTETKLAFVDNSCHQVFGNFSGYAILPCGERIDVDNFTAFCEHAVNNW